MQPFVTREYKYHAHVLTMLWVGLFFGSAAIFFSHSALTNDRGLIINGIIRLSPWGATAFWWVLAALSMGFVLTAGAGLVHRMIYSQRLVITANAVIAPARHWSSQEVEIPYATIVNISEWRYRRQMVITIQHGLGKTTISKQMLPHADDCEIVRRLLTERLNTL